MKYLILVLMTMSQFANAGTYDPPIYQNMNGHVVLACPPSVSLPTEAATSEDTYHPPLYVVANGRFIPVCPRNMNSQPEGQYDPPLY